MKPEQLTNQEIYTCYIEEANQPLRPQDERIALGFARAAFDEFCDGFDLHSNEWLDKGSGEMFKAGYLAALQAQPVAQQPYDTRQFSNLTNQANGYAQQPEGREQVNAALLDACKKAQIAKTTTQIRTTSQPLTPPSS